MFLLKRTWTHEAAIVSSHQQKSGRWHMKEIVCLFSFEKQPVRSVVVSRQQQQDSIMDALMLKG